MSDEKPPTPSLPTQGGLAVQADEIDLVALSEKYAKTKHDDQEKRGEPLGWDNVADAWLDGYLAWKAPQVDVPKMGEVSLLLLQRTLRLHSKIILAYASTLYRQAKADPDMKEIAADTEGVGREAERLASTLVRFGTASLNSSASGETQEPSKTEGKSES
jgi:hypothetical protein